MRAKLVYEKFKEESDPIDDMGIGVPLMKVGGKLQKFAEENGYEFEMRKISKVESPILLVPIQPRFDTIPMGGYRSHGPCMYTKIEYTITYMKHRKPTPFSLRKNWIGYKHELKDEDYLKMPKDGDYKDWALKVLKQYIKKGNLKKSMCKQILMGRFREDDIPLLIKRIEYSIKKEIKNMGEYSLPPLLWPDIT